MLDVPGLQHIVCVGKGGGGGEGGDGEEALARSTEWLEENICSESPLLEPGIVHEGDDSRICPFDQCRCRGIDTQDAVQHSLLVVSWIWVLRVH